MKKIFVTLLLSTLLINAFAQKVKLYNAKADGMKLLDSALVIAKATNKHVMVQIGGNWCSWCYMFDAFYKNDAELDSIVKANYVVIHVNFDGKKASFPILERLEYPHRFGVPVIVIVNAEGRRLHTQNSEFLESGNSYNKKKMLSFFKSWTVISVSPETYK